MQNTHFTQTEIHIPHHNREIYGIFFTPNECKAFPVVIFSHGFNGTTDSYLERCRHLASHGIGALTFDFCGGSVHSKSSLATSEMTLFTEEEDLYAVIDFIQSQKNVNQNNIFLFGESQGGLITALAADTRKDEIQGVLLLYPAFCIPDNWNAKFPKEEDIPEKEDLWGVTLGKAFFTTLRGYDVFKHIGKFEKNVIIFHGDKDDIVPLQYGEKAHSLYPHAEIKVFHGEGHGFSEPANKQVMQMTLDFVQNNLTS